MVTALSASSTQAMFLTCLGGVGGVAHDMLAKSKKFRHVGLGGITGGQIRELEASLYQLQNCRVIQYCVRDVIFFRKWRNHNQRHPEAGDKEAADRARIICANVRAWQIGRILDAVWGCGEVRRHVVIEPAALVIGEDKDRVLP